MGTLPKEDTRQAAGTLGWPESLKDTYMINLEASWPSTDWGVSLQTSRQLGERAHCLGQALLASALGGCGLGGFAPEEVAHLRGTCPGPGTRTPGA